DEPAPADAPAADAGAAPEARTTRGTAGGGRDDAMRAIGAAGGGAGGQDLGRLVDGAKTRVYLKIPDLKDHALLGRLTPAARRGVAVRVYMPSPRAGDGQTVLDAEGLEASGVDICVDRQDKLGDFPGVVDGKTAGGASGDQAAKAFLAATSEKAPA